MLQSQQTWMFCYVQQEGRTVAGASLMRCSEMYDTVMCLCVVGTCWEAEKEMLEVEVVVVSSDLSENSSV